MIVLDILHILTFVHELFFFCLQHDAAVWFMFIAMKYWQNDLNKGYHMPEIHKIGATFILMLSIADVVLPLPVYSYGDSSMKGKKGKKGKWKEGKGRATKKEGARKKNS